MPKMKQLLRKLHIGYDHHRLPEPPRPVVAPNPSPTPSPSIVSTSPSSSGSIGRIAAAVDSVRRDTTTAVSGGVDFNFMEEEFQVQLAMAISASDQGEDRDTAQIDAAKRISLGGSAGSAGDAESLVDFLSLRYWGHKVINYNEKVKDDFYDVYGISSNTLSQGKMPLLVDLQTESFLGNVDYEVILVNRLIDPELRELEKRAYDASLECPTFMLGMVSSDLIQKIADIVVGKMGGRVGSADEMVKRWTLRSYELRNSLNSIILPIGRLDIGLARHRALLFKVLADRINLPCMLVKGSYYTGTDDGAVNLIKLDDGSEYIIDLMGAPGALIPTEVPSSSLPIFIPDARIVPEHLDTLGCPSLVLEKTIRTSEFPASMNKDCEIDLLKSDGETYVGSQPSANDRRIGERYQTERFEHDFGKLMHSQQKSAENSVAVSERPSSAQKIKVKNVSKYVISAAKNPEFAQKLHAVLLESGASPPPDLFVDVNPQELREQSMFGRAYDDNGNTVDNCYQCTPSNAYLKHDQACVSSAGLQSLNDLICAQQKTGQAPGQQGESEAQIEILNNAPPNTTGGIVTLIGAESQQWRVQTDSSVGDNAIERTLGVDNSKMSAIEMMETDTAMENFACNGHGQSAYPFLGEAAKWEIQWEDLQIGVRIGIGSYGEVYHAEWNGTEVAVKKFLDQDFSGDALTQFKSEVEIMLRLRHPNVVLFMGAVTRRPHFSILTEFLPRGSLYRLLHRPNHTLEEKRRLRMALDVVKGMNYLHTSHPTIVHRDLKTPNLLVDKNWAVKVCDFGLSRMKHHTFLSSKSTAGTPEWMAPEVLRNEPANEKCDVYSFGVILWELATLCIPWKGLNPMQVVGAVGFQNRRLEIPKDVSPVVAQVIRECWQTDPHLRPSFTQLMNRLKHIQRLTVDGTNSTKQSTM